MEFPTARASKRDLDVFCKRLEREYPEVFGFWKLEPQKRGAPHYHLLMAVGDCVSGSRRDLLNELEEWIPAAWCDVVGSDDDKHRAFHFRHRDKVVTPVRSTNGVMCYAGKYVGKPAEELTDKGEWEHAGRWWGVINQKGLSQFTWARAKRVSRSTWMAIRRLFRRVAPYAVRRSQAARRVGTWHTFDRLNCCNAMGGSFLSQALEWAIPGGRAVAGDAWIDLAWHFT